MEDCKACQSNMREKESGDIDDDNIVVGWRQRRRGSEATVEDLKRGC